MQKKYEGMLSQLQGFRSHAGKFQRPAIPHSSSKFEEIIAAVQDDLRHVEKNETMLAKKKIRDTEKGE